MRSTAQPAVSDSVGAGPVSGPVRPPVLIDNATYDREEGIMSAPQTNIEKQKRRHSPALIGIAVAGAVVLLVIAVLLPREGPPLDGQPPTAAGDVETGASAGN